MAYFDLKNGGLRFKKTAEFNLKKTADFNLKTAKFNLKKQQTSI